MEKNMKFNLEGRVHISDEACIDSYLVSYTIDGEHAGYKSMDPIEYAAKLDEAGLLKSVRG